MNNLRYLLHLLDPTVLLDYFRPEPQNEWQAPPTIPNEAQPDYSRYAGMTPYQIMADVLSPNVIDESRLGPIPASHFSGLKAPPASNLVNYLTGIDPRQMDFLNWFRPIAEQYGLNPNPYDPNNHYDYFSAYLNGQGPDDTGHWPSQWKDPENDRRYLSALDEGWQEPISSHDELRDTVTGQPAPINIMDLLRGNWDNAAE